MKKSVPLMGLCFKVLLHSVTVLVMLWLFGALWHDLPFPPMARKTSAVFLLAGLATLWFFGKWKLRLVAAGVIILVVGWWLSLRPSADRDWQPEVARTASAEIHGDLVTLHNVRNFDYQSETDFTPRWETRTVDLGKLTGIDMAINYWGSPYMAHPIASFQFSDSPPVCFSIETRKEKGESYSAIGGIYRQYELIYIVADERDVIRVRTNFRKGEDVYLYRLNISPDRARERFMDYVNAMNELHVKPRWYHALTTNCTTSIRTQRHAKERRPWDWRILVNGKADRMLYEAGAFHTGGLDFEMLKQRSLINGAARAAGDSLDFSRLIRLGLPWHEP